MEEHREASTAAVCGSGVLLQQLNSKHGCRSRSPIGGGYGSSSRHYPSSSSPPSSREVVRTSRSRDSRGYSPDRSYSHTRKGYSSSSYGGRRSPVDASY